MTLNSKITDAPAKPYFLLSGLARYLLAATLARMATGGSAVAIILLASSYGAEGKIAGMLAACLTAPHILGPVYGRWLDKSQNPQLIIAGASFLFSGFFQLAIFGFTSQMLWLTIMALLICGTCSSFIMGGLSTQLADLVSSDLAAQRRAQSCDTLTYGVGLTLGPMLIALLTASYATEFTVATLMCLPALAGLIILYLPKPKKHPDNKQAQASLGFRQVLKIMRQSGQLKRTLTMTSAASFSVAALPVLAIYLGQLWLQSKESGAYLVTGYGIGCICGALLLMLRPMASEALALLRNIGAALLVTLLLVAASQSFIAGLFSYWLCGVINSIFFAITLAARREYAPKQGAAQIYMWVAAAKISAASLGTFVAGLLLDQSLSLAILSACAVLALSLVLCFSSALKKR